jgi:hypothetical protein
MGRSRQASQRVSSHRACVPGPVPLGRWVIVKCVSCNHSRNLQEAAAKVRIETPSARAEAGAQARSRSACSRRHAAVTPAAAPGFPVATWPSAPRSSCTQPVPAAVFSKVER